MPYVKKADRVDPSTVHIFIHSQSKETGKLSIERDISVDLGLRIINLLFGNAEKTLVFSPATVAPIFEAASKHVLDGRKGGAGTHKSGRLCSKCLKPGHTVTTCGRVAPDPDEERTLMTRQQFSDVRIAKDHDMTSSEIAENMDLPLSEINRAMSTDNYAAYER